MQDSDLSPVPINAEDVNEYALASKQVRKLVSGLNSKLLVAFGGVNAVKPYFKWGTPVLDGHTDSAAVSDGVNVLLFYN